MTHDKVRTHDEVGSPEHWHVFAHADWASGVDLTTHAEGPNGNGGPLGACARAVTFFGGTLTVTKHNGTNETFPVEFAGLPMIGQFKAIVAGGTADYAKVDW